MATTLGPARTAKPQRISVFKFCDTVGDSGKTRHTVTVVNDRRKWCKCADHPIDETPGPPILAPAPVVQHTGHCVSATHDPIKTRVHQWLPLRKPAGRCCRAHSIEREFFAKVSTGLLNQRSGAGLCRGSTQPGNGTTGSVCSSCQLFVIGADG